jgi:amino acid adenylation domain-containing protein
MIGVLGNHALSRPDAMAISDGTRSLTYSEFFAGVCRLAGALRGRGVAPGQFVPLVLPRGIAMIEAMFAVWQAGAAFLPVDPAAPAPWRDRMVAACAPPLCLTLSSIADVPKRLDLDLLRSSGPVPADLPGAKPTDVAYALRTSGSSGVPKLALVRHDGLALFRDEIERRCGGLGPGSVVPHLASPYFDGAIIEIALSLGCGGRLEVPTGPVAPADFFLERGITHAGLPAAMIRTLDPRAVPGLRMLASFGDVLLPEVARRWVSAVRLINGYGPTETTPLVLFHEVTTVEDPVPIGTPVQGTWIVITDSDLRPVPAGDRGEICVGGTCVGAGYLDQPEQTARRFVRGPDGELLYRTGDIGSIDENGVARFFGRMDDQLKIRGYRVDPEEVERALDGLRDVELAVVVADRRVQTGRLLGYVQLRPNSTATGRALRAELAAMLPAYLVPSLITVVRDWPLRENGKIDRAALQGQ